MTENDLKQCQKFVRFILNSEEQIIIREMVQEIKEEDMWIQKFFEQPKCKNDNPNDYTDPNKKT